MIPYRINKQIHKLIIRLFFDIQKVFKIKVSIKPFIKKLVWVIKFDYLSWFDRELEQFSVAGSLTQDDQSMMLIKSILLENKK